MDINELKAPHVPGAFLFVPTPSSSKVRHPKIQEMSMFQFFSILGFSVVKLHSCFNFFVFGFRHDNICNSMTWSTVVVPGDLLFPAGEFNEDLPGTSVWFMAIAVPWSVFIPEKVASRKSILSIANQTNSFFYIQCGR